MKSQVSRWILGLTFIVVVSAIWVAASFVVQSVVEAGVSPFLITYICNSLFLVYLPMVEIGRYLEDAYGSLFFWTNKKKNIVQVLRESEQITLLVEDEHLVTKAEGSTQAMAVDNVEVDPHGSGADLRVVLVSNERHFLDQPRLNKDPSKGVDAKGRWTRTRVAKVSLLICPFWFLAQLTFNLSLKYTTVTSNTILSSVSSLFTFLVALTFLGEKFTWVKLISVLLCMVGTIVVSLGDSEISLNAIASNPLLGDFLALVSAGLCAVYITLIRKKLPDEDEKNGHVSMAQFLGFLGLFILLIFLPVVLILNFTKIETFHTLTWKQFGVIVGKGLLDSVLSDYLWTKAIMLTTTTVATAGLTIQVPMAAIVDSITGNAPHLADYLGAVAIMIGFAGINIPSNAFSTSKEANCEVENEDISFAESNHLSSTGHDSSSIR